MYREYINVSFEECVEYIRKSRTDDPLLTIEEVLQKQEFELREFAMRSLGGIIPEHQTYREVASSETISDRPEMVKLLKAIESPSIKAVVVREVERLSRGDLMDAGLIIRIFRFTNTLIITPHETYDLSQESDRMIVEMKLKSGNQYLEYSKKIMKRGKDLASMNGEFIAKDAPYGFEKTTYKEGRRNVKTLSIVQEEADVVRLVFESYAEKGMSMSAIAEMLNERKIKPRVRERWTRSSIAEMLLNPVHMGKIRWNYRIDVKSWENQQMVVSRPRRSLDDCILVDGKHEAIISEELFYSAYNRKATNAPLKKSNELKNPLAGIFFCAKCGKAMKLRQGDAKNAPRFECTEMKHCGNGSATFEEVMNEICDALEEYIDDFEVRDDSDNSDEIERHQKLIESLEKKLQDAERKELSIWDKYTEEGMPKSVFDKLIEKVKKEKSELKSALENAKSNAPSHEDYGERVYTFKMAVGYVRNMSASPKEINTFLREIIERITFEREKSVRLTKALAKEMGVPYPHPLCYHNYPMDMEMTLRA